MDAVRSKRPDWSLARQLRLAAKGRFMLRSIPIQAVATRMGYDSRRGFTFVEFVTVAVIITVLAATILPQCSSSSCEAKMSNLKFNLRSVRSQLEKFKLEHSGRFPVAASSAEFAAQFGPFLECGIPVNPFNGSATVAIIESDTPPNAPTGSDDGWQYNPVNGWFYPNDAVYFRTSCGSN
jgi:type II secretory pathway pseudopilin PulG